MLSASACKYKAAPNKELVFWFLIEDFVPCQINQKVGSFLVPKFIVNKYLKFIIKESCNLVPREYPSSLIKKRLTGKAEAIFS